MNKKNKTKCPVCGELVCEYPKACDNTAFFSEDKVGTCWVCGGWANLSTICKSCSEEEYGSG